MKRRLSQKLISVFGVGVLGGKLRLIVKNISSLPIEKIIISVRFFFFCWVCVVKERNGLVAGPETVQSKQGLPEKAIVSQQA